MAVKSYASVWDACAETAEESVNLRVRSQLMRAITRVVRGWELPQTEAAKRLGVSQPRLNDLLKGKIDKFSLDALVNMLAGADLSIAVEVRETDLA